MSTLEHLMRPINVKNLNIPNRVVMPPMGTNLGKQGEVTEANVAYLKRRAQGGAGLIITEILAVHPLGAIHPNQLAIYDDRFIPGLTRLADAVHSHGGKIAAQLHHCGRESIWQLNNEQAMGPSAVPSRIYGIAPKAMTIDDIHETISSFGRAAARARSIGFDAVEIHGAHGYLLTQFLSAHSNRRKDEYGGSFKNRARFIIEVLQEIRRQVGDDYPVLLRISAEECVKDGYTIHDVKTIIPDLVQAGADVIHVSFGTHGSPGGITSAPIEYQPGFNLHLAWEIKSVTDVPVIGVGRFTNPFYADECIRDGHADMIAFGRQFLADPDFLHNALNGKSDMTIECLACNQGCIEREMFEGGSIRCAINPETGQELIYPREQTDKPGIVWVIGGGPAGLTAAYEAARLGHQVTLFEKKDHTGGQVFLAAQAPFKEAYGKWISQLTKRAGRTGVQLQLSTEVTEKMLDQCDADLVILAVGAKEIIPAIPGVDQDHVYLASQVLSGNVEPGWNVLIIGGGLVGMETADYLAQKGVKRITIIEEKEKSPVSKHYAHGYMLHKRLKQAGVDICLDSQVTAIEGNVVHIKTAEKTTAIELVDQVIIAAGMKPDQQLSEMLTAKGIRFKVVGDAVVSRRIIEAVEEGAKAAWEI